MFVQKLNYGAKSFIRLTPARLKVLLFARLLLSSVGVGSTFLSTGSAGVGFSASTASEIFFVVLAVDAWTTDVFDVLPATVDDDGFRDVSTLANVDDGFRDASLVCVVFPSAFGSAFRADFALATIPALWDFTWKKFEQIWGIYKHLVLYQHFIFFVTYEWAQYSSVFVPGKSFKTSLMYLSRL